MKRRENNEKWIIIENKKVGYRNKGKNRNEYGKMEKYKKNGKRGRYEIGRTTKKGMIVEREKNNYKNGKRGEMIKRLEK